MANAMKKAKASICTNQDENPGLKAVLHDPMTVKGRFLFVSGKDAKPERMRISEILEFLERCPSKSERAPRFVGTHAGRPVVAVKHRCVATIEFGDCRSPFLPPL